MTAESDCLYQAEVKLRLAEVVFPPAAGWDVQVHLDGMERARGGRQQPGKAERVAAAERALRTLGVQIGVHEYHGRVDFVAEKPSSHRHLIEVEGDSSRPKTQAIHSCLAQILMAMRSWSEWDHYGVAVPGTAGWERRIAKISTAVRSRLNLDLYVVRPSGQVLQYGPKDEVPKQARA